MVGTAFIYLEGLREAGGGGGTADMCLGSRGPCVDVRGEASALFPLPLTERTHMEKTNIP